LNVGFHRLLSGQSQELLLRKWHGDGRRFEFQRIGNYLGDMNRHAGAQAAGESAGRAQCFRGTGKAGVDHVHFELRAEDFGCGDRR